ncbi:MAG TPA: hypothetical protein VJN94_14820 [Candidatus Binataceae bacterium]|nr:hypothetical protein [Candidatus Binataceae bacterium]
MKFQSPSKTAAIIGAVALMGATALPAWSGQSAMFDDAVVLPTQQETQQVLGEAGERMRNAALASFESPVADSDYLAAQRDYEFGRYEQAMSDAQAAEQALPDLPNWDGSLVITTK